MAANIPTSFSFSTFIRVLLPGFIFSLLCTYFVFPIIPASFASFLIIDKILMLSLLDKILFWAITGLFFGMLISSFDYYIYRFFTGSGILPQFLWDGLYRSIIFEYNKLITDYDTKLGRYSSSEDPEEHRKLYRDLVDMSNKLRKFPFDIDELCTRPISPTRLGNIINEYESYPKVQYGMNFNVFWSRLWQIISKDSRDDLDFRAAKADFLIYILTIWILFSPVITYRVSTNFGIPAIFIIILCFLIALILYDIAVLAHENYGDYVKATFDLYRIDLAKKLGIPISLCPRRDEMAIWEKYNEFLHHCDVPESVSQLNNIIER